MHKDFKKEHTRIFSRKNTKTLSKIIGNVFFCCIFAFQETLEKEVKAQVEKVILQMNGTGIAIKQIAIISQKQSGKVLKP